jgi:ATP-dependent Lon protease
VGLQYDFEEVLVGRKCIVMVDLKPVTAANIGLEDLAGVRRGLALDEWLGLLMNTCGLNPNAYSWRQKLLYLCRLLSLIEENVYLIELGPRATGKTYIYRNMTRYARIFSGGRDIPRRPILQRHDKGAGGAGRQGLRGIRRGLEDRVPGPL